MSANSDTASETRRSASQKARRERFGDELRKSPMLLAAISGIAGIVLIDQGRLGWFVALIVLLACLSAILWGKSRGLALVIMGSAMSLTFLGWRQHSRLGEISRFPLSVALSRGISTEIQGEGWVSAPIRSGDASWRSAAVILRLVSISIGGHSFPCNQDFPCRIDNPPPDLAYGSRLKFSAHLDSLESAVVPGAFDAHSFYFRRLGAMGRLTISDAHEREVLPERKGSILISFAIASRASMERALYLGVPTSLQPYASLVAAMVLGARENSPEELQQDFRNSGTMHLFAVSGLHVALVTGILAWILSLLSVPKTKAVLIIVPAVLFYAVLTGLSPSALRAAIMATVFLFGYAIREKPRLLNSLGLAAMLLLAFDPQQIFQPGFQLSFAAVLSIALLTPELTRILSHPFLTDPFLPKSLIGPWRRFADRTAMTLAALLAVSVASWIGSATPLAVHFQSLALVGVLANLIMVPLAGVVMSIAAVSLLASALRLAWIVAISNHVNAVVTLGLATLAHFFANLPGATLYTGVSPSPAAERASFALDVVGERGESAALIDLPTQNRRGSFRMLIDSGGERTYSGRLLPLFRSRRIQQLDALMMTHGDIGHIGAMKSVLGDFRPALILESALENRSPVYSEIVTRAERLGIERRQVKRGDILRFSSGLSMAVLYPDEKKQGRIADDRTLVLKLEHAGWKFLFTSDGGFAMEKDLLESGVNLRADVWLRGQHLENPSGSMEFVQAISPRAVISSHSDFPLSERIPEALRVLLQQKEIPLFETESDGLVQIRVMEDRLIVRAYLRPDETVEFRK